MHDRYGIDVDDQQLMRARSWRWLRIRITGLLDLPPTVTSGGQVIEATRLGFALRPPKTPTSETR